MILVHRMDTLIKLILRTILRNVKVDHAGIFIYDKTKDAYVVEVSKGKNGMRVPSGFMKVKKDNPLIRYFTDKRYRMFNQDFLLYNRLNYYLRYCTLKREYPLVNYLKELKEELNLIHANTCIPGFFRNNLVGILFLGAKRDRSSFTPEELGFLSVLASDVVMALQNAWLFEDLNKQLDANKKLFLSTVSALSAAIEAKDKYTLGHTERVVSLSLEIAKNLENSDIKDWTAFRENLSIAALLHDIGKIAVPERILNKKTQLTPREREFIHKHPIVGIEILSPIQEFKDVMHGVKYHHERYDGKGYPFALKGADIPLIASIISVADTYDAMTTDRPYRKAFPKAAAAAEIKKNSGKQFVPLIVDAFLRYYQKAEYDGRQKYA